MSKKDLLFLIDKGIAEDRKNPEAAFQRMVKDGLIDKDGRPVQRERRLNFNVRRDPEPDDRI